LMHEWSKDHFEFHTTPVYLFWCEKVCHLTKLADAQQHCADA
jgi:hypothetical protein